MHELRLHQVVPAHLNGGAAGVSRHLRVQEGEEQQMVVAQRERVCVAVLLVGLLRAFPLAEPCWAM